MAEATSEMRSSEAKRDHVHQPAWPGVDVRVSKGVGRNALIVLDRLFKSLEKSRVEVSVTSGGYGENGTYAIKNRLDKVLVYVTEENKKVPHVPNAKELREQEQSFRSRIHKHDSVPTGKLTLVPGGVADLSSDEAIAAQPAEKGTVGGGVDLVGRVESSADPSPG